MLNVSIIGVGNCGNQVAALAYERLHIPVIAINSSEKDLETVPSSIPRVLLKKIDGTSEGAGKDRKLAKEYMRDSAVAFFEKSEYTDIIDTSDIVFIVSSTGGGTGSGIVPVFSNILDQTYKGNKKIITVGVLPSESESLDAHVNTFQYLTELKNVLVGQTYMLYDNEKASSMPSYKAMEFINNEIVNDINVLRCFFNYTTKYDSIDSQDMMRILECAGRVMVTRLDNFKDKDCDTVTIEQLLIDKMKKNAHVEGQRDKRVNETGLIVNLSNYLLEDFDTQLKSVKEFIGEPNHGYTHLYINAERSDPNNVFLIMSGLTFIHDKCDKIKDRIEEIEERQKSYEQQSALDEFNIDDYDSKLNTKANKAGMERASVDIQSTFSKFGL